MNFNKNNPFYGMPVTDGMNLRKAFETLESTITDDWMEKAIDAYFRSQKDFAEFLGVGQSTVTNWVKAHSFPDQAKRLLVYTLLGKLTELSVNNEKSKLLAKLEHSKRTMVVEEHGTFSILSSKLDDKDATNLCRKIVARHIPELQIALHLAGSDEAWAFVEELRKTVLSDHYTDSLLEKLEVAGVHEDDIADIRSWISQSQIPFLMTYNALKARWTDPKILKQETEEMAKLFADVDWNDVFNVPKKNVGEA
jgi:transcriptional regulator with XRE-family HTH domain